MKKYRDHTCSQSLLIALCLITILSGCKGKRLNEQLTFWKNDKIPYGTYYAYSNLESIFPDANISVNDNSPKSYDGLAGLAAVEEASEDSSSSSVYMIITPTVEPTTEELQAMLAYLGQGNHILISAMEISNELLDSLRLKLVKRSAYMSRTDSLTLSLLDPVDFDTTTFAYPGMQLDNYVKTFDKNITQIVGYNQQGKPNFVRFSYEGGGTLYLHFAPAAFTNFFLLHKNNKTYYDQALSYLPADVNRVIWDDYFRYHRNGEGQENNEFSALSWMMKQPAFAWMISLLLLLFGLIYLFESKRKQRAVPLRPKLKNASVDFVKTIGRLYFQRKDNKNLATKMTTHFLEQVRARYNITTSVLDANFQKKLSHKSGSSSEEVAKLVNTIDIIQQRPLISDELLLSYHNTLEKFINKIKDGR